MCVCVYSCALGIRAQYVSEFHCKITSSKPEPFAMQTSCDTVGGREKEKQSEKQENN